MIYSIGHSTHTMKEFLSLVNSHQIDLVVDIRSMPGSKRFPHFNKEQMEYWLPTFGMSYVHMPELGGRRKNQNIDPDTNSGWTHKSFRNYADYGLTADYAMGIRKLIDFTRDARVAYMCSEAVPWRCHRNLVSNSLVCQGVHVEHIINAISTTTHELGMYGAKPVPVSSDYLTYPGE